MVLPTEKKPLECKKCGYKWHYKGTKKVRATCPDCHNLVNIKGEK